MNAENVGREKLYSPAKVGSERDSTRKRIEAQEQRMSLSLGRGCDPIVLESATRVLTSAPRHPDYVKFD